MKKYDGWVCKDESGKLLSWSFCLTRKEVINLKIGGYSWKVWEKLGSKLVKVKFVEVA